MADEDIYWRLVRGDETAFRELIHRLHGRLLGLARTFVGNNATAEEVVQDTWLAVVEGLPRLDKPASLNSWIYSILANKARRRAVRDSRTTLFSDFDGQDQSVPVLPEDRFTRRGHWKEPVALWDGLDPERIVAGRQLWGHVRRAIDELPPRQQAVVLLRDVEGLSAAEACEILDVTESHQRVLLHRGRARLRQVVEALITPRNSSRPL